MKINNELLKKNFVKGFIKFQSMPLLLVYLFAILLIKNDIFVALFSIIFLSSYVYFVHIILHKYNFTSNMNLLLHKNTHKPIKLLLDSILNIIIILPIYFIQNTFNIRYIPNIIIMYFTIIYVSNNIMNLTVYAHSPSVKHNKKSIEDCNYGPDILDHIFSTNCDNKWENGVQYLPNIVFSYLICILYKNY